MIKVPTRVRTQRVYSSGHSGAERSPGQKKHIIGGSYIVWNVCAVRFGNSWRKNMALGSFGEKCKKAIFVHFWLPFLVLALSCNFFLLFLVIYQQTREENTNIRHAVPPWGILLTCRAQKEPICLKWRLTGRKASKWPRAPQECPKHRQTIFPDEPHCFHASKCHCRAIFGSFLAHFRLFGAI